MRTLLHMNSEIATMLRAMHKYSGAMKVPTEFKHSEIKLVTAPLVTKVQEYQLTNEMISLVDESVN